MISDKSREVRRIQLWGIVQGVGMRPLAVRLALELGLTGFVRNSAGFVEIMAAGESAQLDCYQQRLIAEKPAPAVYIRLDVQAVSGEAAGWPSFSIVESSGNSDSCEPVLAFPAPDLAICEACELELDEPENRRYRHAFNSCMHCGPRYSILKSLPYDREATTMSVYPLCKACETEYTAVSDRRFHAQTIACPDCGPQLIWQPFEPFGKDREENHQADRVKNRAADTENNPEKALKMAINQLQKGQVIAVKATGGYHLACLANDSAAVRRCREIKQRDLKPFAVLFSDLDQLNDYAEVNAGESDLLLSQARPIVLLKPLAADRVTTKRPITADVAMSSPYLGAMLPSTPIQKLLVQTCGPLVMTSANRSDELLIYHDQDMLDFGRSIGQIAGVLMFERDILNGLDDSVLRWQGRPQFYRRARGYVPLAIDLGSSPSDKVTAPTVKAAALTVKAAEPISETTILPVILALGADLKATTAWSSEGFVWLSQPSGDLENLDAFAAWQKAQTNLQQLLNLNPTLICRDLHPGYLSSEAALQWPDLPKRSIQHHHAHIASVIAEHQLREPVIGVALDGTGYGTDGTIWGGEFLRCEGADFQRLGHFKSVKLPGGDLAMKQAWRSLAGYLEAANLPNPKDLSDEDRARFNLVRQTLQANFNCLANSSVGRLFDAFCALLGLSEINHFEGECGSLLEAAAERAQRSGLAAWPLDFDVSENSGLSIDPAPVFQEALAALSQTENSSKERLVERLALGFHVALVQAILESCLMLSNMTGIRTIALSGGVFQNAVLKDRLDQTLIQQGLRVYWNEKVPPHDGGICLGQAFIGWLAAQ